MRLTSNLKAAIVKQFKHGASVPYLAALYQQKQERVEKVIRDALFSQEFDTSIENGKLTIENGRT